MNLPCFCTHAWPERFAEINKKIKNQKSLHGVGIKTVFEKNFVKKHGNRKAGIIDLNSVYSEVKHYFSKR